MKWYTIWDEFNRNISIKMAKFFSKDNTTEQIIGYGINVAINGMEKIMLLIIAFYLHGSLKQFAIAMVTMIPLRIWMGGTHRKTLLGCTLQTYFIFRIILYQYKIIGIYRINPILIMISILIVCLTCCPMIDERRGGYSINKKIDFKKKACFIVVSLNLLIFILGNEYKNILQACEIIQMLDVFIAKIMLRKEKEKDEGKRNNKQMYGRGNC